MNDTRHKNSAVDRDRVTLTVVARDPDGNAVRRWAKGPYFAAAPESRVATNSEGK